MRIRPTLAVILLLIAAGCSQSSSSPTSSLEDGGTGSLAFGESGQRDGGRMRGLARPNLEFLPFNGRLLRLIGEKDLDNRYATTVMVHVREPPIEFSCSGVLLHPRLVVTAGHCVCQWRKVNTPGGTPQTTIDGSACAKRAEVTAILHKATSHPDIPGSTFWERTGTIKPHPEFESHLTLQGEVLTSRADLAVILLEQSVDLGLPTVSLADAEAKAGELLVMSSYGSDPGLEQFYGSRYFRNGKVKSLKPEEGRVLYEPAGAYFNTSYRGGPCLRELNKAQHLVGIVGLGSDEEMSFTSIYSYRSWLHEELRQVTTASPNVPRSP